MAIMNDRIARIGVGVFVFKDGKFLMGRRKNSHGDGTWSLPGGHLEFGESFEQTAEREVFEETGLKIKNVRFGAVTNDFFKDEDKHYVTIWMLSDWQEEIEKITEPDKYIDMGWYGFDNLPSPLFATWNQLFKSQFIDDIKRQLS